MSSAPIHLGLLSVGFRHSQVACQDNFPAATLLFFLPDFSKIILHMLTLNYDKNVNCKLETISASSKHLYFKHAVLNKK